VKTAVDSSVLLDVLTADPAFGERSREALRRAYDQGALIASDVVWAEVRASFTSEDAFARTLDALGVRFDPMTEPAARLAGQLWRESHRAAKGRASDKGEPKRVVADLLVGAHALLQSDALLARDRGYFRRCFRGLKVLDPSAR
jgi:predicted nucleic acid-binding protein